MKKIIFLIAITLCFNKLYSQPESSKTPNGKIVAGCLINTVGLVMLYQSVRILNDPIYNFYAGGETDKQQKSIAAAGLGGVCLVIGTVCIVKGVYLQKNNKLKVGVTYNGIKLIYKI